jgi:glycosyltransferase involved in cell wall biosynthesis
MKVGFIIYGSIHNLSGGYLYDRSLVKYLSERGDKVDVISIPFRNYFYHLLDNFNYRLPLNYDILIQDELNHPSLITANLRNRLHPVVSLVHHLRSSEKWPVWQDWFYRFIEKIYLRSVDGYIFNSETTANSVNELIPRNKPTIIAYPPTDRFGNSISQEEIKARASRSPFRLLFLGNLIPRKGLHVILDALAAALRHGQNSGREIHHPPSDQEIPEIYLDIVGSIEVEPVYTRKIQKKVIDLGLDDRIHFHGSLDTELLRELLTNAHLLVVPSSYEGYGIAYLEGMCFGLPAIGSTQGAAREIITDGINGYLIEPEDSRALLEKILKLEADRKLLTHLSLAARQRYLDQPSWLEIASSIRDFLVGMTTHRSA